MKPESLLILLNDRTKKLYTVALTTDHCQNTEQEKNGISRPGRCYVAVGAIYQWTYLLLVALNA
jgi:hypothetical protein